MSRLVIASTNTGKVREIRAVLGGLRTWTVASLPGGTGEAVETGATFLENAVEKAEFYSRRLQDWVVADDSGLEVDALDGRPGVFSSRYAPTDPERIRKLLAELDGVDRERRTARFVCALALAKEGRTIWTTEGTLEGRIASAPRGGHGFGYDPVFYLPERGCTLAELAPRTKNRISHRGRALAALRTYLETDPQP